MANIFKEQKAVNEHPKRNNFDLSKKSNVSMKFGTLYPVYCQPVIPGDSFSIETAFNLKLLPVVFPVQTKMRAHMHFFYVRNKNLWNNWENWISNLVSQSEHPHPYISVPDSSFKNGSIHDFLGVPTSVVTSGDIQHLLQYPIASDDESETGKSLYAKGYTNLTKINAAISDPAQRQIYGEAFNASTNPLIGIQMNGSLSPSQILSKVRLNFVDYASVRTAIGNLANSNPYVMISVYTYKNRDYDIPVAVSPLVGTEYDKLEFNLSDTQINYINTMYHRYADDALYINTAIMVNIMIPLSSAKTWTDNDGLPISDVNDSRIMYIFASHGVSDYSDLGLDLYTRNLRINALPYRAYESIYYCYYNNNVLHPLTIGGQVQYNRYNTKLGDGADDTNYHLFQRNYELDFLTSSLPSPQQGVAPLVGMSALGDITIEDENGITTAHADIDNDGTITKVVLTSPAASNEHARVAMNMASCGMSINDFRQTNALQRMLETNIRKGYRYMDFIAGHFGKEPEYRELDLPEFIGGFSRDVSVSTVVSNADTLGLESGAALGEYGGYAQVIGGSNHAVRHYCDDFGYIIGILSVVPTPCYSQLLPKHMIAPDNFLDYPFPEFMQSGLMPITYKEVAPIQAYLDSLVDSNKRLEDTFGYQRPNYDLVSAVDEVHGEFRGSLRDYVINRIFDTRPELGQDFISINPDEINDIFVNRNPDDDTIIGEIGFSVYAKRPVPRVVIPNLGR